MSLPKTAAWQTCRVCDKPAVGVYMTGLCCVDHTPAALAGRPEPPVPDPDRTASGLLYAWQKRMERRLEEAARRRAGLKVFRHASGKDGRYTLDDVDMDRVRATTARLGADLRRRRTTAPGAAS